MKSITCGTLLAGPAEGYSLQWAPQFPAFNWYEVTHTVSEVGGRKHVTLSSATGKRFFRLLP